MKKGANDFVQWIEDISFSHRFQFVLLEHVLSFLHLRHYFLQLWCSHHCTPWGTRPHPIACRPSICGGALWTV